MATDNHNFSQPARGAENWDQDWYDNFDALDERVALSGPAAERTNYTAYEDSLYIATDTEEVYEGTGTTWEQLESFGSDPTLGDVSTTSVDADSASVTNEVSVGSVNTEEVSVTNTSEYTVNVPGDFATVEAATNHLNTLRRPEGVQYVVNIQSSHTITETITFEFRNYRHIRIESEDVTVPLANGFSTSDPVIFVMWCIGPRLFCSIDTNGNGHDGVQVDGGGMNVALGCGS